MAPRLSLREWQTSRGVPLTLEQRDALLSTFPSISITPTPGRIDAYDLKPGSHVGVARFGELEVEIRPKIEIDRLLFLLSYIADPKHWRTARVSFRQEDDAVEAVAAAFVHHLRQALSRGLLQGYRHIQEAELTVRGRILFDEQLRKRFGSWIPVQTEYDDYTIDTTENQLLLAAVHRLRRIGVRQEKLAGDLRHAEHLLQGISRTEFDPRRIPCLLYNRLNEHYRPATELARLILEGSGLEQGSGDVPGLSFVVDMNDVVEDFVVVALRESLGLTPQTLIQGRRSPDRLWLDEDRKIVLKPDIAWWEGDRSLFVADVKYKELPRPEKAGSDFYQLLAYLMGTGLKTGLLIFAASEGGNRRFSVRQTEKVLEVRSLDISGSPEEVLAGVYQLAEDVKVLADQARSSSVVA